MSEPLVDALLRQPQLPSHPPSYPSHTRPPCRPHTTTTYAPYDHLQPLKSTPDERQILVKMLCISLPYSPPHILRLGHAPCRSYTSNAVNRIAFFALDPVHARPERPIAPREPVVMGGLRFEPLAEEDRWAVDGTVYALPAWHAPAAVPHYPHELYPLSARNAPPVYPRRCPLDSGMVIHGLCRLRYGAVEYAVICNT
ncbi:hypothetical protein FKP32DRAFT_252551 [Trametes sanguinea]|nr:hypothetical protein FKP32DRAFT_252551 [Trametes sanguinea]